jgi:hypothetical protein
MPTEVTSVISPDTILPLALASAIFSAIALIVNAIIPFFTQRMANKHALQMAKAEQWNKAISEAFQELAAGSEILIAIDYDISYDKRKIACKAVAEVMPFLEANEIESATQLLQSIESLRKGGSPEHLSIRQEYTRLLNILARKMEGPVKENRLRH